MRLLKKSLVMDELNDFIKIYENSLEPDICDYLINVFDPLIDYQERIDNDGVPNFTQINLTKLSKESEELNNVHDYIVKKTLEYKKAYYKYIDKRCFPEKNAFEQFRIKRYLNDDNDFFDTHVDVTDHESSRRFLSFFWYLNDVDEGGKTVFKDLEIKPEKGKLVIFPPVWLFPHRGEKPISGPKYLLSTYLHYK